MTNKTTSRIALNYAIEHLADTAPVEIIDKYKAMLAALDKKSSGERKPTKTQEANAELRAEVVAFITEYAEGDGFTVSDLLTKCSAVPAGTSNQKLSAILKQAVEAKELSKHSVKRRTYFVAYDPQYDTAEVEG